MMPKEQKNQDRSILQTGESPPSILIVDDEAPVRDVLCRFFNKEGFEVSQAPDGGAALKMVRAKPFDVVLSDLKMPGLSGLEVLKQVKQLVPEAVVLIFTAYPSPDTTVKALELSGDCYVSKPLELSRLKSLVVHHLMLRRWERENRPQQRT